MPSLRSRDRPFVAAAAVIGAGTWLATMASAPRHSFGDQQDMGNAAFFWILLAAALVGGLIFPRSAVSIAFALGLPPLALSPWTAPRGDGDGLWILIVPMLALFTGVLGFTAFVGSRIRRRWFAGDPAP